jgi:hypothetical protein
MLLADVVRIVLITPELNEHPAQDYQKKTKQGKIGNSLFKIETAKYNAYKCEHSHINAKQSREIPFDHIDRQPVTTQYTETGYNQHKSTGPQTSPNEGIATHLQYCSENKNQPGCPGHVLFTPSSKNFSQTY